MSKMRDWLKGKKTYIAAAIGILGAMIAWSESEVDTVGLLAAVWAAIQASPSRAGIANGK